MSKTSSQRQRDLIIAQQRREEIEKQNEATLRLAKQKQQLEIKLNNNNWNCKNYEKIKRWELKNWKKKTVEN